MTPEYIRAADCVSRFFRKCAALDRHLQEHMKEPKITGIAAAYFKPGMTFQQRMNEALFLEEALDQTLVYLGLKDFN